jgi:uncharacterized protein
MDDAIFVDANVFLRFFVKDAPALYEKAKNLFEDAENGKVKLQTSELVVAEIVWVLESYYDLSRKEIVNVLATLLASKNLRIANHARVGEAVKLYASGNMDFVDAYNIAYVKSKEHTKIATFDVKHFKKIEGLTIV